ncbi:MAG TPA: RNA polymerase sigma factor [Gaiella sp.]|jgi:RNA polymerase sigma-70 factor (ECF subfamily)
MDETAAEIERLYRERYVRFRNGVATITGSHESARDAVQEGFARALQSRDQFRGDGSLEGWVWRIVLRCALRSARSDATYVSLDEVDPQLVEDERDPVLATAIRSLTPRRRLVVFLRYFADLRYETIAEICEIDTGTVAATLAQARRALAESLEEEGVRS